MQKNKNTISLLLIILCIITFTGCTSTNNYKKNNLKFNPDVDIFYIIGAGDDTGSVYHYQNILKEYGFKSDIVFDIDSTFEAPETTSKGTGFYISENDIVTNAHVIDGQKTVTITKNGKQYNANIKNYDPVNDIAILSTSINTDVYFELGSIKDYTITDSIFTLGYPLTSSMGTNVKITQGIINSTTGYEDNPNLIQISSPIQPGNSGGPVINSDFKVIGIATATLFSSKNQIQNVNYAIKSDLLKLFTNTTSEKTKIVSNINQATSATVLIEANSEPRTLGNSYIIFIDTEYSYAWGSYISTLRCMNIKTKEVVASTKFRGSITMTVQATEEKAFLSFVKEMQKNNED